MGFESTPVQREVDKMVNEIYPVNYKWYCLIKAGDQAYAPIETTTVDIVSDFENKFADEIIVEVVMGAGTYQHAIYPKKNDLTITLFRRTLNETKEIESGLYQYIEKQELRAIILDTRSTVISEGDTYNLSQGQGDLNNLMTVRFQVLDKAVEQLRGKTCGGVFRETKAGDVLNYMLTQLSKEIQVDKENRVKGVQMVPLNNSEPQKHILIPHGTPFLEMPEFLHEKCGGIYNAGFGFYLYRKQWFVYPLYDTTLFRKAKRGLTIINIPKDRMPGRERTYRLTERQLIVLATGDTVQRDQADIDQYNKGNGTRFTDARAIMENYATVKDNVATTLRRDTTHEYLLDKRKSGFSNVMLSPAKITSNPFLESSRLAARNGSRVVCVWENSDPSYLEPGMAVRYQFVRNGTIFEIHGVLLSAHTYISSPSTGMVNTYHTSSTALMLFLEPNTDWLQIEQDAQQA